MERPVYVLAALILTGILMFTSASTNVEKLSTDFGIRVFNEIVKSHGDWNVAFSPYGVASVMARLQLGSAGDTQAQIKEAMKYGVEEKGVVSSLLTLKKNILAHWNKDVVKTADSMFLQRDLELVRGFYKQYYKTFHDTIKQVNFTNQQQAIHIINDWVKIHTEGMIPTFLNDNALDQLTRMVLVNAIYFKGLWKLPFQEHKTRERLFHKSDGSTVFVPMMEQTAKFNYSEFATPDGIGYDVIELPYHGETISMLIAAPFQKDVPLSALTRSVSMNLIDEWKNSLKEVPQHFILPKFALESEIDLKKSLTALGISDMFTFKANFAKISREEQLFVSKALQKVKIEVNESGTKASAATAAILYARMAPIEIVMDRPFLFVVRHNPTGVILFMGQVMEP